MTIYAFEASTRTRRLETAVVESGTENKTAWAVLEDTVLYPEGGGQPSDRGFINGVRVLDVQKSEGRVRHQLEGPVSQGPCVVELDWERRWDHMQQHSAQHLLTAVALEEFGWSTTAFHLGPDRSDIELDATSIDEPALIRLEDKVAERIHSQLQIKTSRVTPSEYQKLPVRSRGLPAGHSGDIRLVEIVGLDLNTCGGTHVSHTGELGTVSLLGTESMRGGTRLFYAAGDRVRRRLREHENRARELRSLLNTGEEGFLSTLSSKLEQLRDVTRHEKRLEAALADTLAAQATQGSEEVISVPLEGQSMAFLQQLTRKVLALDPGRVLLATSRGNGPGGVFVLGVGAKAGQDLRALGAIVTESLEGRGGGAGEIFQGRALRVGRHEVALQGLMDAILPAADQ